MRVARLHAAGLLTVAEEPDPTPGPAQSLVRVGAVGLCGSDLHWWSDGGIGDATLERPLVLGHEMGGIVVEGPLAGRRVAIDPAIPDETCEVCRAGHPNLCPSVKFAGHSDTDGGLRELMAWPSDRLHPVPDSLDDAAVSVLEPLGVALHALDHAHLRLGATVAVVGCGPIGLLTLQVARAAGAGRIIVVEPLAWRRREAMECGADVVLEPAEVGAYVRDAGPFGLASVVFDAHGSPDALASCVSLASFGGRVVLIGIPDDDLSVLPAGTARRKGLTLAIARRMGEVYPRTIALAASGRVDPARLVSAVFPLAESDRAFRMAAAREGLKVVITP